ncbi:MAG: carbohydrate kinase family protein [Blautia sp.]|uniref:Sugar kinase n=1 Tax=Blautia parvula TaxID=2877527 RepID=A0ABQ0BPJ6_9FIRM|nr:MULTISPECIES: carbohydrate kinase family protein [Blautia]MCB6724504.1 carbohydrate kinase family protein [Blautia marasmi]MCI5962202.1 carbohydrate kinase family protein [Clostridia bacterium]MCQ4737341.1 carbohydrate kinase family protein [Blautia hominis]MCQ5093977.1 carbohydrate kinase family protein [Blautia producta]MDY4054747.1 carbohydrate kinase family protein [Blautia sp.]
MGKKVIVAGHACLDITPLFPQNQQAAKLGNILSPGKLIQMEGVDIHAGGAVSNTGMAMKMLGADVCLMAKTGSDEFGKIISDIYAAQGADSGIIVQEGQNTSYSVVLALPGIDRIFLHDPGCNHTFSFEDLPKEKLLGTDLFHFGYPPLMKKMYEDTGSELVRMMKYMKAQGTATSLDLAFVDGESDAGAADWKEILSRVLPYVDFFVPSIEELCFMLDRDRYEAWKTKAGDEDISFSLDVQRDIRPLADKCMELGAKVLLLKCGAPGLYYRTTEVKRLEGLETALGISAEDWSDREGFEASYQPKRVLSGTGAGDTTIAAFLTAMLEGYPFEMCIHLAAAEGASCVEAYDALSGIRPLKELASRIEKGWKKQNFRR